MTHPVPLLDLAPKRKTPLSLWNPLDYLLLLYWVFFFPQAIYWYVLNFRNAERPKKRNWREFRQFLRDDPIQRSLFTQALLLMLLTTTGIGLLLQSFDLKIDWLSVMGIVVFNVLIDVGLSIVLDVSAGAAIGVAGGIAGCILEYIAIGDGANGFSVGVAASILTFTIAFITIMHMVAGIQFGTLFNAVLIMIAIGCLSIGIIIGSQHGIIANKIEDTLVLIAWQRDSPLTFIVSFIANIIIISTFTVLALVTYATRWPDFLINCLYTLIIGRNQQTYTIGASRITWLSLPGLQNWLKNIFQNDPDIALQNINQLLQYSLQFIPVVHVLNDWLADLPKSQVYQQVNALASHLYDDEVLRFCTASLSAAMWRQSTFFLPKTWRERISKHSYDDSLRTDTSAHAACAGYWLMHKRDTTAAMEAFSHNRHILHGETFYQTARALDLARKAENLQNVVEWETENNWLDHLTEDFLRPQIIDILRQLRGVSSEASVAAVSYSKLNRSTSLNRALGTLTALLDDLDNTCSELELPIVREIAENWRDILARQAGNAGQQSITQPVENPFVVGNPVTGKVFVGRDDVFRYIEDLWGNNAAQSVPSLVLFGHRRMGKTSILQNLGERRFGVHTIVAQFTMQRAGRLKNTGELLAIFAENIHEALAAKGLTVSEPDFAAFEHAPYQSFNRFLSEVKRLVTGQRVILTIDEFELIEEAIQKGVVDAELLSYLRGIIHSERWFVLALAGLHTLEEMTADYWNPLFSSVTPVRVSFLTWEATANLLANPHDDFPLDFTREAIDRVYAHANGQPFLTQLIGHTLVRLYNQSVFENLHPREARFSAADVDEVVERPEFYEQGHYYFQGVWSQAESTPPGQRALLRGLALADGALTADAWQSAAGFEMSTAQAGIQALLQHDVVMLKDEQYDFAVPLMRKWLRKSRDQESGN